MEKLYMLETNNRDKTQLGTSQSITTLAQKHRTFWHFKVRKWLNMLCTHANKNQWSLPISDTELLIIFPKFIPRHQSIPVCFPGLKSGMPNHCSWKHSRNTPHRTWWTKGEELLKFKSNPHDVSKMNRNHTPFINLQGIFTITKALSRIPNFPVPGMWNAE